MPGVSLSFSTFTTVTNNWLAEEDRAVPCIREEQKPDKYTEPTSGHNAENGADCQQKDQQLGRPEYVVKIGVLSSHGAP